MSKLLPCTSLLSATGVARREALYRKARGLQHFVEATEGVATRAVHQGTRGGVIIDIALEEYADKSVPVASNGWWRLRILVNNASHIGEVLCVVWVLDVMVVFVNGVLIAHDIIRPSDKCGRDVDCEIGAFVSANTDRLARARVKMESCFHARSSISLGHIVHCGHSAERVAQQSDGARIGFGQ